MIQSHDMLSENDMKINLYKSDVISLQRDGWKRPESQSNAYVKNKQTCLNL